jgi:hypothetical protein
MMGIASLHPSYGAAATAVIIARRIPPITNATGRNTLRYCALRAALTVSADKTNLDTCNRPDPVPVTCQCRYAFPLR